MVNGLRHHLFVCILGGVTSLGLISCSTVYPVTTGSHVQNEMEKKYRMVIWATHPAMASTIMSMAQQGGNTIVERSRLDQVFKEQQIRLTHTSDDDAQVLRVGKLLGADRVIFAEHTISSSNFNKAVVSAYGGSSSSQAVYNLSVSIRSVDVETGEVRASGTAYYPKPITNPDAGLIGLTRAAVARAACRIEKEYEWKELNGSETGGCRKKE